MSVHCSNFGKEARHQMIFRTDYNQSYVYPTGMIKTTESGIISFFLKTCSEKNYSLFSVLTECGREI